jgi:hypothetical protein
VCAVYIFSGPYNVSSMFIDQICVLRFLQFVFEDSRQLMPQLPGLISLLRPDICRLLHFLVASLACDPEYEKGIDFDIARKLTTRLMGPKPRSVTPLTAEANLLNIHPSVMSDRILEFASACHFGARALGGSVFVHLARACEIGLIRPVCTATSGCIDESQFRLRAS